MQGLANPVAISLERSLSFHSPSLNDGLEYPATPVLADEDHAPALERTDAFRSLVCELRFPS